MSCAQEYQRKNYSVTMLNYAIGDDSGSWWWWTNVIGTLCFGTIGLIGNTICFLVLCRFSVRQQSFVQYLRALSIFDFLSLFFEFIKTLNSLLNYLFSIHLLNFRPSIICKFYEFTTHVIDLLACWTIVGLTFDRLILVCVPWSKRWPNLSRRICNSHSAKRIIALLITLSLIINIPHLVYQKRVCRQSGYKHSAAYAGKKDSNQTETNATSNNVVCQCRISSDLDPRTVSLIVKWQIYVFHLVCYTLLPAIILIASNAAILKLVHAPRQIVGQQNEHLRSKLTRTLTSVSLMFLILYFPHALVDIIFLSLSVKSNMTCNIDFIIQIRILKRLSELLNIAALGINFFLYILGVNHYRSAAIQMLGLHHFNIFVPYLTSEHRNSMVSMSLHQTRRVNRTDSSSMKRSKKTNNMTNSDNSNQPLNAKN